MKKEKQNKGKAFVGLSPVGKRKLPTGRAGGLRKKVFVGLSGGVDSSVSATLLKEAGYDVTGVFIKVWQPDFISCNSKDDRLDAMRVAAHLGIPFRTLNLEKEYKRGVVDYMLSEYKKGNTPNPDVMCNKEVKFGAFLRYAMKEGADFVATGHYTQNIFNKKTNKYELHKGADDNKDQSYFLWTLTQKELSRIIFPVGAYKKEEVRKLAEKFGLITATKKDSQGLCFLGKIDMKEFLKHYIKEKEGIVVDSDGNILGTHEGVIFYTLGERHGFTLTKKTSNDKPYYVIGKNIKENKLIVSRIPQNNVATKKKWGIRDINWISPKFDLELPKKANLKAQIRYHGEFLPCKVFVKGKETFVIFKKPILVSFGQSIVFYRGNVCLGGGIIS